MKIHRDNYEAYLLDLIEGGLTDAQQEELFRFLGENPDIAVDFDAGNLMIPPGESDFPFKNDLKKGGEGEITRGNFGQFCIARLEGDLSAQGVRELENFLEANPDCSQEAAIYNRLLLSADKSVKFPVKGAIRKKHHRRGPFRVKSVRSLIYVAGPIAASVAVLLSVWLFLPGTGDQGSVSPLSSGNSVSHLDEIPLPQSVTNNNMPARIPVLRDENYSGQSSQINTAINAKLYEVMIEDSDIGRDRDYQAALRVRQMPQAERSGIKNLRVVSHTITETGALTPLVAEAGFATAAGRITSGSGNENYRTSRSPVIGLITSLGSRSEIPEERERFTLVKLAQAGVKGLNSLVGTDLLFERELDPSGKRINTVFSAGPVEIQRSASIESE